MPAPAVGALLDVAGSVCCYIESCISPIVSSIASPRQPAKSEPSMNRIAPASTVERYFTLHYAPGLARNAFGKSRSLFEDVCVARHHNGVCLLCLSPRHPVVTSKSVSSVDYRVEMRQVKGKRKKGGIVVEERTRLCTLVCENDELYEVQCAIKGTLIEYNEALKDDPSLVVRKPLSEGYLAAVLPWASRIKTAVDHLMPADTYEQECRDADGRQLTGSTISIAS